MIVNVVAVQTQSGAIDSNVSNAELAQLFMEEDPIEQKSVCYDDQIILDKEKFEKIFNTENATPLYDQHDGFGVWFLIGPELLYATHKQSSLLILLETGTAVATNSQPSQAIGDILDPKDTVLQYKPSKYKCGVNNSAWVFMSKNRNMNEYNTEHPEKPYLRLMEELLGMTSNCMYNVNNCRPDRTGVGTISCFGRQLRFDISQHVPLITTKKVNPYSVIKELLFFLRGETDSRILEKQGVNIWKDNTSRQFLDARGLETYNEGDMGPMYGFQWRHFGAEYKGCDSNYAGTGVDQLSQVEYLLKTDPYSRRIVMTTYNPQHLSEMALPPCHGLVVQFYVSDSKKLSCHMYQRSVDVGLGLVWNTFSYAVLTHLLAKRHGLQPEELIISTGDTHIYMSHIDACFTQVGRSLRPAPMLEIDDSVVKKSWEEIEPEDIRIRGYYPHGFIKMPMAV